MNKPVFVFYGDDFTGSSAVADVLESNGLRTILFLKTPTREKLAKFSDYHAIGIASTARAQSVEWAEQNLPSAFSLLAELKAPFFHYKVCSTLDSSPEIGSIGKALDLAAEIFPSEWFPLVLAAPQIKRYQVFGHLFAGFGSDVYRLDRHPVMSRHPVTPMDESDVLKHLSAQTDKKSELFDLNRILEGKAKIKKKKQLVSLDAIDEKSLCEVGRILYENRGKVLACFGSQAVEYALCAYWREAGLIDREEKKQTLKACEATLAIAGSCSKTTAEQIKKADDKAFSKILLELNNPEDEEECRRKTESAVNLALEALEKKLSPLIYSTPLNEDVAENEVKNRVKAQKNIGFSLGNIAREIKSKFPVQRIVVAGGDTSGFVSEKLGLYALRSTCSGPPGGSLFHADSDFFGESFEVAFKGGQMGSPDYFNEMKFGCL